MLFVLKRQQHLTLHPFCRLVSARLLVFPHLLPDFKFGFAFGLALGGPFNGFFGSLGLVQSFAW